MTGWFEGAVLTGYFLLILVLGWSKGRGERGVEDYVVARRDIPWWAVLGSVVATEVSAATYLAVPGGFVGDRWFGSVSADKRNGLGLALQKGKQLVPTKKRPNASTEGIVRRILPKEARRSYPSGQTFKLLPGPQFESFSEKARQTLVTAKWLVSALSDRTGYRLEGPELDLPACIRSEPVLPGSFQIPGGGLPIITMVDGPTVGGYPKIAVLPDADRDRLAQCAPGTQLSFQWAKS